MQVDRGKFLLLTASMAAGSCGPPGAARAPQAGASADAIAVAAPPITIATDPGEPAAPANPVTAPSRAGDEAMSGDGSEALKAECRGISPPPGPHCESFDSTLRECEIYAEALRPEPAERATHCLTTLTGTPLICDFSASGKCLLLGVLAADPLPSADRPCGAIINHCSGSRGPHAELSRGTCRRALSAVKPARHDALLSCMSETCSISGCIYDLAPPR